MSYELESINMLPSQKDIKKIAQSLAVLDMIIMPEWEYRYFSFDAYWDTNEMMSSMRNGEGDEYFILFNTHGTIGKVFTKDKLLSTKEREKVIQLIPKKFSNFIAEEAFSMENISFCFWSQTEYLWTSALINTDLPYLKFLSGDPIFYQVWAEEYYERNLNIDAIQSIFNHEPISDSIIEKLNNDIKLEDIITELKEIDY